MCAGPFQTASDALVGREAAQSVGLLPIDPGLATKSTIWRKLRQLMGEPTRSPTEYER
jgi:hypothetical protein